MGWLVMEVKLASLRISHPFSCEVVVAREENM
jgi:hypothetical protein